MNIGALSRGINHTSLALSNVQYLFRSLNLKQTGICLQIPPKGVVAAASCIQRKGYATKKSKSTGQNAKQPPTTPLEFEYSGELAKQVELDAKDRLFLYQDMKELEDAPEAVKKMFSIEFASGREKLQHRKMVVQDNISKVVGPQMCLEKQIANLTVKIRNLIPYCQAFRKDKAAKSHLVERIQMRKKLLKYMRRLDYERFQWLLTDLKVKYVSPPAYYGHVSVRARRKREVREAALAFQREKLAELKEEMEKEKEEFLVYKAKVMSEIDEDIKTYNLNKDSILQRYLEKTSVSKSSGSDANKKS